MDAPMIKRELATEEKNTFEFTQVSSTAVNHYGSVLRDAVLEGNTDFIRILLDHG